MRFAHKTSRPRQPADAAAVTQRAYMAEAAFEYFISITISGAFLTLLIKQLGVSDALTGILSSVTILACSTQVLSVSFIRRRHSIRLSVLFMQTLQQLLYGCLYLLPFVPIASHALKVGLFSLLFLTGAVLNDLVVPAKFNWMMSFVQPSNRGAFTAHKEMLSLASGLVYNFCMSRLIDRFNAEGRPETGLRLCAAVIFVATLFHVSALLIAHDAPQVLADVQKTPSLKVSLRTNLANKSFVRVMVLAAGWNFLAFLSTPYYSVYLLQELHCSVTFIAVAGGIIGSLLRVLMSVPMGHLADRRGFDHSIALGFLLAALAFGLMAFWTPANGRLLYLLFQLPYAGAMATLNGGMLNVVFQYVPQKDRVSALGLHAALGGIGGFLGSLAGGWVLNSVQEAGNTAFGLPLYGQQLLNALSAAGLIGMFFYSRLVIERMKRLE